MREPAAPAGGAITGHHHPPADALVVLVKTLADFDRVRTQQWYRLPLEKALPPLLGGQIRQIAFYLPKAFGQYAFQVTWTAPLLGMTTMTRRELLPEEPAHARSDHVYVRLALGPLAPLPRPIPSRRLRRIVFIPTTRAKLETAGEINDLFHASPLEDIVWQALKAEGLQPERQYYVPGDPKGMYALDFALFGQQRNLDIECDGDAYHLSRASARYDNRRNNFLTSRGWSVLRFTSAQIAEELPDVMYQVRTAIKDCGGMAAAPEAGAATPAQVWQPGLWGASREGARDPTPRLHTPRKARPATTRRRRAAQQGELPHSIVEQLALF